MNKVIKVLPVLLLLVVLTFVGCGKSGGGNGGNAGGGDDFVFGTWKGSYFDNTLGQTVCLSENHLRKA
ncbi:MAG: hypothetical protein LBV16_07370 [Elusimicrobiota bacterium]|jgi:hypothetical protein|nr:hypothetical protein [Elusimicrobiota bacterium]